MERIMPDILQELESIKGARNISILPQGGFSVQIRGFGFKHKNGIFEVTRVRENTQMSHLEGLLFTEKTDDIQELCAKAANFFHSSEIQARVFSVINAIGKTRTA
jgi:hypothetical protein